MKKNKLIIDEKTYNEPKIHLYLKSELVQQKDRKLIEKTKNIHFNGKKEIYESDDHEGGIFDEYILDFSEFLELKESFVIFLENAQNEIDDENIFNKIINFLKVINNNNITIENLKGDIGEALLIIKYIELGYGSKIMDSIRQRDDSVYDFYLSNNIIEVKNSSIRSKEIKINHNQIPNEMDKNIIICVANTKNLKKVNENHKNILDLYNLIESHGIKLNNILKIKKSIYEQLNEDIIDNNSIDINDYYFSIILFEDIRKIKIEKLIGIKDLIYILDISKYSKVDDNYLVSIIK